ncbi:hypothetical protein Taro_025494 [Colocasia esculenta]|uniref:Transposase (putative) gypsy type domain-containing protein n=1 Tax=Colocasia esculenta TaxID=4460 RepID=A0A843VKP9_COLES|nr:hypothetical protein [Colocasia esculenta]
MMRLALPSSRPARPPRLLGGVSELPGNAAVVGLMEPLALLIEAEVTRHLDSWPQSCCQVKRRTVSSTPRLPNHLAPSDFDHALEDHLSLRVIFLAELPIMRPCSNSFLPEVSHGLILYFFIFFVFPGVFSFRGYLCPASVFSSFPPSSGVRRVADAATEIDRTTLEWIVNHLGFVFPPNFTVYTSDDLRAHHTMQNGFCLYSESIRVVFRYPLHPFLLHLLLYLEVTPSQLAPNSWRSAIGFLVTCALAKVSPSILLFFYCFSIKVLGDWLYISARSGRHFLGRLPSSIHHLKRSFCFTHSPRGWDFPTTWMAINPHDKAFWSLLDISDAELSSFESLQAVSMHDLLEPSVELFELIRRADRVALLPFSLQLLLAVAILAATALVISDLLSRWYHPVMEMQVSSHQAIEMQSAMDSIFQIAFRNRAELSARFQRGKLITALDDANMQIDQQALYESFLEALKLFNIGTEAALIEKRQSGRQLRLQADPLKVAKMWSKKTSCRGFFERVRGTQREREPSALAGFSSELCSRRQIKKPQEGLFPGSSTCSANVLPEQLQQLGAADLLNDVLRSAPRVSAWRICPPGCRLWLVRKANRLRWVEHAGIVALGTRRTIPCVVGRSLGPIEPTSSLVENATGCMSRSERVPRLRRVLRTTFLTRGASEQGKLCPAKGGGFACVFGDFDLQVAGSAQFPHDEWYGCGIVVVPPSFKYMYPS